MPSSGTNFGPHKVARYSKPYHDVVISPSGVWRILKHLGMSRLRVSQHYPRHTDGWKRYEKPSAAVSRSYVARSCYVLFQSTVGPPWRP